jgi:hypothetical protein
MLALVGVLAAVVIPLASGQSGKTYTLVVTSSAPCASPATATVAVKNTTNPQPLGSIEIYFPPNTVDTVLSPANAVKRPNATSPAQPQKKDIVAIDDFNVASGATKEVRVKFLPGVSFNTAITAVAKQSNKFNDASGSANTFDISGGFPTLKIVTCVTVSGRVYQDRNLDNVYSQGQGAFTQADVAKSWTVKLFAKNVGDTSYPTTAFMTTTSSGADGSYTFSQVPTLSDYKICVTVTTAPDSNSMWSTQIPTGNQQCAPIATPAGATPPNTPANLLTNLGANAPGQDFQVVPVVGPVGQNTPDTTVGGYTVDPASNSDKHNDYYVQAAWTDAAGQRNFRFSPINPCGGPSQPACPTGHIYLLETLVADIGLTNLGGKQALLRYDDDPPFTDAGLKPMPYCLKDPRAGQPAGQLATSGVLPPPAAPDTVQPTSCIVEASQNTLAAGVNVHTEYTVYTAYDGGRQVGVG